jgi:formate hydrogenlyase subunit 3/multisubunit Na+/H+ antiporter MnhD subunit
MGAAELALVADGASVGAAFTSALDPPLGADPLAGFFLGRSAPSPCLVLRGRGEELWAALAFAAALLDTLNRALFKALVFLGAGAFERAAGPLAIDQLGGLLRRLPWTGGAFLVGCAAIAG